MSRNPSERSQAPLHFSFDKEFTDSASIKVVGVGGAGGNAIGRMIEAGLSGVDFIDINTDAQVLSESQALHRLQIGRKLTKGLGSGGNPEVGRRAIEEDLDELSELLQGADMVFVTAGMGGGTGTGAAPVVAEIARKTGALTVGVVTKPFSFEGKKRNLVAETGLTELRSEVDTLITIPNERLLEVVDQNVAFSEAFRVADDVLLQATRGISDLITVKGMINLDFADVKSIMAGMGPALMGTGQADGKDRAELAAEQAIRCPLLEELEIAGAQGVLINITGSSSMTMHEVTRATEIITQATGEEANVIFGTVIDEGIGDAMRITVIATGFQSEYQVSSERREARQQELIHPAPKRAFAAVAGSDETVELPAEETVDENPFPFEAAPTVELMEIAPESEAGTSPVEPVMEEAAPILTEEPRSMVKEATLRPEQSEDEEWTVPTFLRKQSD